MEEQYIKINKNGSKFYFKDREMTIYHRTDGPAIEWADGSKYWYIDDMLHREDGPAIEYIDGYKAWYIEGKRHRTDGAAIEWSGGTKYWFIHNRQLSEKEFNRRTSPEIVLTMDEIASKLGIDVSKLKIKK
jgi:hypothetical protein